jgi:hypothetical protein
LQFIHLIERIHQQVRGLAFLAFKLQIKLQTFLLVDELYREIIDFFALTLQYFFEHFLKQSHVRDFHFRCFAIFELHFFNVFFFFYCHVNNVPIFALTLKIFYDVKILEF